MSRTRILLFLLSVNALVIAGCGSDGPSQPHILVPEGTGSLSMRVIGEVSGRDIFPGVYITEFDVRLTNDGGSPISGAIVNIKTPTETVNLIEDIQSPGDYYAARNGYASGYYILSASRDSDWVAGVSVTAPDVHQITSPTSGDTVAAGQPLPVLWTRQTTAQEATVTTRDYESPGELDDGQSVVPGTENPSKEDQRIRVYRRNRIQPAGGLAGSIFEVSIRNTVEPVIVQ